MGLLQHLYERRLEISHYSHCRAVWGGEHTLQISYVSIIKGVLLCLLVSTKAFGKFHASFIYRDAGDGVERWPRLDRVVRYGIGVLSEGLHHES
jgi:hypothetical protein